jgi:hypothetical protein
VQRGPASAGPFVSLGRVNPRRRTALVSVVAAVVLILLKLGTGLAATDKRIPKPLRWLAALGLAPIPGPFDEALETLSTASLSDASALLRPAGVLWVHVERTRATCRRPSGCGPIVRIPLIPPLTEKGGAPSRSASGGELTFSRSVENTSAPHVKPLPETLDRAGRTPPSDIAG